VDSTFVAGLIGALIGALTSIGTLIVQNVYQSRRDMIRLIFDTAYKDYELRIRELPENVAFPVILDFHQRMARLAEKGQLTPASVRELMLAQTAMGAAVYGAVDEARAAADAGDGAAQ
jgi:hypothetical protein